MVSPTQHDVFQLTTIMIVQWKHSHLSIEAGNAQMTLLISLQDLLVSTSIDIV